VKLRGVMPNAHFPRSLGGMPPTSDFVQ
jgi:hypothetical protein